MRASVELLAYTLIKRLLKRGRPYHVCTLRASVIIGNDNAVT